MRQRICRALCVASLGLWLAGCAGANNSLTDQASNSGSAAGADAFASAQPVENAQAMFPRASTESNLLGSNPLDDLNTGKSYYRSGNFGMAERYFRRAVETHPRDAEAWLDLAASYDRLRRFDLADRAYGEAIKIVGPRIEILNNQGYSLMLRGDVRSAYAKLTEARHLDLGNRYVQSNLRLLADTSRNGKAIE